MTYEELRNGIESIRNIADSQEKELEEKYTRERCVLKEGQMVKHNDLRYVFTGYCAVGSGGSVLYEIELDEGKLNIINYKTIEELEVVE